MLELASVEKTEYYRSQTNLYKKVITEENEVLYKYDFALNHFCVVHTADHQIVGGLAWQISYFTFKVILLYWRMFK